MNNSLAVGITQRIRELGEETVNFAQGQWTFFHLVFERSRFEIPHDEIGDAFAFAVIEDRQNVRVLQPGNDTRLLLEALREFGALRQLPRQDFDRHVPIHGRLIRLIDGCHASFADLTDNSVGAKHLPGLKGVHVHTCLPHSTRFEINFSCDFDA